MVNFSELKAKAGKAKDITVSKVSNTRDKLISTPSSKINWDPNWKRPPPPPPPASAPRGSRPTSSGTSSLAPPPTSSRSRPDFAPSNVPPQLPRGSRPTDTLSPPPPYTPPPPPTRAVSGYPPAHRDTPQDSSERIDWVNLSQEDKEEFFTWLDEFFSRFLGVEMGPRSLRQTAAPGAARRVPVLNHQRTGGSRSAPNVNLATRPQA